MKVNTYYNEKINHGQVTRTLDVQAPFFREFVRQPTRKAYVENPF